MRGKLPEPREIGVMQKSHSTGFTYTALLAAIVIIGITMGAAAKSWQNISIRDKEEELLFRGNQYLLAIQHYYLYGGRRQYPQNIDDLLKDNRSAVGRRHLRQKFKDPITGEDFVEVRDILSKRIVGVHSSSDKEPLKQGNFQEKNKDFEGKKKYSEWIFQFVQQGAPQPATAPPPHPHPPGLFD